MKRNKLAELGFELSADDIEQGYFVDRETKVVCSCCGDPANIAYDVESGEDIGTSCCGGTDADFNFDYEE